MDHLQTCYNTVVNPGSAAIAPSADQVKGCAHSFVSLAPTRVHVPVSLSYAALDAHCLVDLHDAVAHLFSSPDSSDPLLPYISNPNNTRVAK